MRRLRQWAFRRKMPKKNPGAVSNQMMNSRIHLSLFAIVASMAVTGFAAPTLKEETPLLRAVADFNKKALLDSIGKAERPITEEEVIASILLLEKPVNAPVSDELFQQIKKIAATKVLPVNAKFESLNGLDPGGSYIFDVWSVRIRMDRPDRSSYAFLIRQRVVGSRALQEDVARLDSHIDVENVARWVGGYRILDRQKELVARIYTRIEE